MTDDKRTRLRWRVFGLAGTAVVFYLIFGVALANVDIGWLVPTNRMANAVIVFWQNLPFFTVDKGATADGKGEVVYYTVPTQLVTPREMARLMGTNVTAHPAPPAAKTIPANGAAAPR